MIQKLLHEPVIAAILARLLIAAGSRWGLHFTEAQALAAALAVGTAIDIWTRQNVTPNVKVDAHVAAKVEAKMRASIAPDPINVPVEDAGDDDLETTPTGKKP